MDGGAVESSGARGHIHRREVVALSQPRVFERVQRGYQIWLVLSLIPSFSWPQIYFAFLRAAIRSAFRPRPLSRLLTTISCKVLKREERESLASSSLPRRQNKGAKNTTKTVKLKVVQEGLSSNQPRWSTRHKRRGFALDALVCHATKRHGGIKGSRCVATALRGSRGMGRVVG